MNKVQLNQNRIMSVCSSTRLALQEKPDIDAGSDSKVQNLLLLSPNPARKCEGGLRAKGYFKKSFLDMPLISVITVVFNGEKYIEETIKSVVNQTYSNVEFIIIDGGSTDGTIDIIKGYEDAIDYYVSEPDKGISDAFNKGICVSTGTMIGLINADDWYEPDAVEQIASIARVGEADIVHGKLQYWHDELKTEMVSGDHKFLDRDMTVNHMTVFVKRALYQRIGGFSLEFRCAMDYEFLLRAKKSGARFQYLDRCLANMRLGGISDIEWRKALQEGLRIKRMYSNMFLSPYVYYIYQLTKSYTCRTLKRIGMHCFVNYYHARLSLVRKIANRN